MILFCPNCGERSEIPGHMEANVAQRCPSCGAEFGAHEDQKEAASTGRLKISQGGETAADLGLRRATGRRRATPLPVRRRDVRRCEPADCELSAVFSDRGAGIVYEARAPAPAGKPAAGGQASTFTRRQAGLPAAAGAQDAGTEPVEGARAPAPAGKPAAGGQASTFTRRQAGLPAAAGAQDAGTEPLEGARDGRTGDDLLVRRLLPDGGSVEDAARWGACATRLLDLRHPRVVPVLGVGLREGSPYVAVERATGRDLSELAGGGPIKLRQAVSFAIQIADGLSAAHGVGVVHGNLKPSNIMVDPQGAARVMDFGYAPRALDAEGPVGSSHVMGWLPFAAPEVVRDPPAGGEGPERADERSDSYGLGALLYFMLTGKPPFSADSPTALVRAVFEETPLSPAAVNPTVPDELNELVMRALEKDPDRRPVNAQAIWVELQQMEREGLARRRSSIMRLGRRARDTCRRRGRLFRAAFVLAALCGIGYGVYFYVNRSWVEAGLARARSLVDEARGLERGSGGAKEVVQRYRDAAELAKRSPEEARYLVELARALLRAGEAGELGEAGEAEEAVEVLARAGGMRSPEAVEARALLPAALATAGRIEEAVQELGNVARIDGAARIAGEGMRAAIDAADRLVALGVALGDEGKAEGAAEFLEALVEFPALITGTGEESGHAGRAEARAALGDAYASLERTDDARKQYGLIFKSSNASPAPAGAAARQVGTAKVPARPPGRGGAAARAAEGLERLSRHGRRQAPTLTAAEEGALEASPVALARYARTLLERGLTKKATELAWKAARAADPETVASAWAGLALGEAEEAAGKFPNALSQFRKAKSVADGLAGEKLEGAAAVSALSLVGEGRVKLRSDDARSALAAFREVSRAGGGEPFAAEGAAAALVGEAAALRVLGRPDEAASRYRKVMDVHARERVWFLRALCGRGEVQLETRAEGSAVATFERLAAERGAGFLGMIARTMLGETSEGELLAEAFDRGPDLAARAYYCAGLKRDLAGRPDQARAFFKRAAETSKGVSWYRFLAKGRMKE